MSKDWNEFKNWLLTTVLCAASGLFVYEVHALRTSVQDLNTKIASLIEKTLYLDKTVDRHDLEIKNLLMREKGRNPRSSD